MSEFNTGDRVRVILRVGPHAAREGTVLAARSSGFIGVELDGSHDEIHFFLPYQLEVFDPAPAPKTALRDAIIQEWTNPMSRPQYMFRVTLRVGHTEYKSDPMHWDWMLAELLDEHPDLYKIEFGLWKDDPQRYGSWKRLWSK